MFWPFLKKLIVTLACARALKNESESGQKHIYARQHQLYSPVVYSKFTHSQQSLASLYTKMNPNLCHKAFIKEEK